MEVDEVKNAFSELENESKMELEKIREQYAPESIDLAELQVSPRKSDIAIGNLKLVWVPFWIDSDGIAERAV